jgi:hypothetical protein
MQDLVRLQHFIATHPDAPHPAAPGGSMSWCVALCERDRSHAPSLLGHLLKTQLVSRSRALSMLNEGVAWCYNNFFLGVCLCVRLCALCACVVVRGFVVRGLLYAGQLWACGYMFRDVMLARFGDLERELRMLNERAAEMRRSALKQMLVVPRLASDRRRRADPMQRHLAEHLPLRLAVKLHAQLVNNNNPEKKKKKETKRSLPCSIDLSLQ